MFNCVTGNLKIGNKNIKNMTVGNMVFGKKVTATAWITCILFLNDLTNPLSLELKTCETIYQNNVNNFFVYTFSLWFDRSFVCHHKMKICFFEFFSLKFVVIYKNHFYNLRKQKTGPYLFICVKNKYWSKELELILLHFFNIDSYFRHYLLKVFVKNCIM